MSLTIDFNIFRMRVYEQQKSWFMVPLKASLQSLLLLLLLIGLKNISLGCSDFGFVEEGLFFSSIYIKLLCESSINTRMDADYHDHSSRYKMQKGLGTFDLHSQLKYKIGEKKNKAKSLRTNNKKT